MTQIGVICNSQATSVDFLVKVLVMLMVMAVMVAGDGVDGGAVRVLVVFFSFSSRGFYEALKSRPAFFEFWQKIYLITKVSVLCIFVE